MAHRRAQSDAAAVGAGLGIFAFWVVLALVVFLWQYIVAGILIFLLVLMLRLAVANAKQAPPAVHHPPKRVRAAKAIEAKPKPASPAYAPRWSATRRKDAARELAQWQERFDAHSV